MKKRIALLACLSMASIALMSSAAATPAVANVTSVVAKTVVTAPKASVPAEGALPTLLYTIPDGKMNGTDTFVFYFTQNFSMPMQFNVYPAFGRTFKVQFKDGETWTDIAPVNPNDVTSIISKPDQAWDRLYFYLPMPGKERLSAEIRVYSPATAYDAEFISQTIGASVQNLETYDADRTRVKAIIEPYCGSVQMVHYGVPSSTTHPDSGNFNPDTNDIAIVATDDKIWEKNVALHECAHAIQDRVFSEDNTNLGETDQTEMAKTLLAIYGELPEGKGYPDSLDGIEQNADCMSFLMGADVRYSGYITADTCTGARKDAAQAILDGHKP